MNWKTKRTAWLTAAAAVAVAFSLQAQNANSKSSSKPNDRSLGHVERADKIIGREVENANGQHIGEIEDLVVDLESGRVLYAVVSAGGFLGVGDRDIAVPVSAFTERERRLQLAMEKKKLMQAPEYSDDEDKMKQMTSPEYIGRVATFFGQNAWVENSAAGTGKGYRNVHRASDLEGMDVRNLSNETLGEVEAAAIDLSAGRVPFVIVRPDRSLDLKNKLLVLPPNTLTLSTDKDFLTSSADKAQLASAPGIDKNSWSELSNPTWAARVYQHFGKQPYFQGGSLQPTSSGTNLQERIYHEPRK
jgi:sporulation protein YlmC with PRC-barrel domain